jgi:hypothetical protein
MLMLGLEAPASAAVTITALSPTSGPTNCVVVATGTGFTDFPAAQMTVDFVTGVGPTVINAPDFAVISATTLWVVNPGLSNGVSYNLRVANPSNTPGNLPRYSVGRGVRADHHRDRTDVWSGGHHRGDHRDESDRRRPRRC